MTGTIPRTDTSHGSQPPQPQEAPPEVFWEARGLAGGWIHKNVDRGTGGTGQSVKLRQLGVAKEKAVSEVTVVCCGRLPGGLGWKQSKAVVHTGVAHFLHGQSSHRDLREADRCVEGALIGHHEPHQGGRQQVGFQAAVPRRFNHNAYSGSAGRAPPAQ